MPTVGTNSHWSGRCSSRLKNSVERCDNMTDKEKLIQILQRAERKVKDINPNMPLNEWLDIYADELLAEGVIVPPCKVGDTVWEINTDNPFDEDLRVMEAKVERFFIGTSVDLHCMDCVGKTVFLSKEEAEAKLKERKDG